MIGRLPSGTVKSTFNRRGIRVILQDHADICKGFVRQLGLLSWGAPKGRTKVPVGNVGSCDGSTGIGEASNIEFVGFATCDCLDQS